ncbi:MAG: protein kinase [Candidatus Zixiibacteriota bacterium]
MFEPESKIGHFKIIRKLGEGGMGEVYLAEDEKLGRKVAIKVLQKEFFDNAERLSRFNREARTAAKINHPNVMSIYDIGEMAQDNSDSTLSYIVMEYIEGESLSNHIATKNPKLTDLLRIGSKIASGLAAAHKLGIVHRDIKMENIMINSDGEIKILDFGLAKPIESALSYGTKTAQDNTDTISEELTKEGKIVGTITYMSPEQARGEAVDNRADIFSFGILLYKMFTGEFPFKGNDNVSTIAKILEARHEPIRIKNETLPAELERIIDKTLQKDPNDRYQDTRDLAIDIRNLRRQFDSGVTDSTSEISGITQKPKISKTFTLSGKKLLLAVGGLLIIFIIVVAIIFGAFWKGQPEISDVQDWSQFGTDLAKKIAENATGNIGILPEYMKKKNALAILSFENKTDDKSLDWLQSGLPEILMTDLTQNGTINIISRQRIFDQVENKTNENVTHQDYLNAAKSLGATKALSGSFFKMGDKIRIDAHLEDINTGQIILGEKVIGDEPFALVDSLTVKIAQSLNIRESLKDDQNVASLTTSSPEAYKEYTLGMSFLEVNTFDSAIYHFEKAIQIDSAFALTYVRLGMTYGFQNRGSQALPYFMKAEIYKDKLTVKDRSLLGIFIDIWQNRNFDDAFAKLESYVANYPDDKEARTFYGMFLLLFAKNDSLAMAQFDTVLMIDPQYHLALTSLSDYYYKKKDFDKAIEYASLLKLYYPKSVTGYAVLMNYYFDLSRFDECEQEANRLLEIYPDNNTALTRLSRIGIIKRDFESAQKYLKRAWESNKDDHYKRITYYSSLSNLDYWQGKFKSGIEKDHRAVEEAIILNDSTRISGLYSGLADTYYNLNMPDSAIKYGKLGYDWSSQFQDFDYPIILVRINPHNDAKARPMMIKAINNFKSKVPEGMWAMADILFDKYDAIVSADTLKNIELTKSFIEDFDQENAATIFNLGRWQVLVGLYDEGISNLKRLISGKDETTDGFIYNQTIYYTGWANFQLGNKDEAVKYFEEFLSFWGDPEIEIPEVVNARNYLSKLRS